MPCSSNEPNRTEPHEKIHLHSRAFLPAAARKSLAGGGRIAGFRRPYHDWNERITAECYAPNAHARLLDGENRIERIVNNYSKISFNFGPTLLSWMKEKAPDIHRPSWTPTRKAAALFRPWLRHGAVLQPHHHAAGQRRDKQTQVRWGIRDFE